MYYDKADPKNWGLSLSFYETGEWGSVNNGKISIPYSMKQNFIENETFNKEKWIQNMFRTFTNALIFLRQDLFDVIKPINLGKRDYNLARQIICLSLEEAMINGNLYQITKARTFQSEFGTTTATPTPWSAVSDLFGQRAKSMIDNLGRRLSIIEIDSETEEEALEDIKAYIIQKDGNLKPVGKLNIEDFNNEAEET